MAYSWYYSVVDIIGALTDSTNARRYWTDLKAKMQTDENNQLYDFIVQLKLKSSDGKKYSTDCADAEGVLRIIQSVPSKKAEPFKMWLARVGKERLDEIEQPAKAIERGKSYYLAKGYNQEWVQSRIAGIDTRVTLTDSLKDHGIKAGQEYALLTNEMYKSWSGFTAVEYKDHKRLDKKDSLRDNMTPMELATTLFSETAAKELIEKSGAEGFVETKKQIHIAGSITKEAVNKIEAQTGKKVVTHKNMKELNSPEIQKELIKKSWPKDIEYLERKNESDFDKTLERLMDVPKPPKKDK